MKLHLGVAVMDAVVLQFVPKLSLILRPRVFPRKRIELFRYSGCLRNAITVVCALEHREIHNVLSVRRVTADEDPHLQDGIFERFSDRVPESVREWKTFRVSSLSSAAEQRRLFAMHFRVEELREQLEVEEEDGDRDRRKR